MVRHNFLVVLVVILTGMKATQAAEQRCGELGANCVCSEPLQMTGFTTLGPEATADFWNPTDSTSLECNGGLGDSWNVGFAANINTPNQPVIGTAANRPEAWAALPNGHSVSRFFTVAPGAVGFQLGHHWQDQQSINPQRRAMRWYEYHSPDFTRVNVDNAYLGCNTKGFEHNNGIKIEGAYGYMNMYNWLETSPAQDCCYSGPWYSPNGSSVPFMDEYTKVYPDGRNNGHGSDITDDFWNNKWYRHEVVITNADATIGSGKYYRLEYWVKDVTNNGPLIKVMDTRQFYPPSIADPNPFAIDRQLSQPVHEMHVNAFRAQNSFDANNNVPIPPGTQCHGYRAVAYLMVASWNNDAGQTIGAASEMEGGLGGTNPTCGDSLCTAGETCASCSGDCGACPPPPPSCGDATCDANETCSNCETDCGTCPTSPTTISSGSGNCRQQEDGSTVCDATFSLQGCQAAGSGMSIALLILAVLSLRRRPARI